MCSVSKISLQKKVSIQKILSSISQTQIVPISRESLVLPVPMPPRHVYERARCLIPPNCNLQFFRIIPTLSSTYTYIHSLANEFSLFFQRPL